MLAGTIGKYQSRIRSRTGVGVEHLSFHGRDEDDARRKVEQIYNNCQVLDCVYQNVPMNGRLGTVNYEDVVDLISTR